jgi:DNA-binding GntR family transcriptional regulator
MNQHHTFDIDRRRKESVDIQLFNSITQAVQKQLLPPNTQLNIDELHELVPELTVQQIASILDEVVQTGVARKNGKDYFTLTRKFPSVTYHRLEALHDMLNSHYTHVREEISEIGITKHYPKRFKDAEFRDREPLYFIQRKYYADHELIAFSNSYLPVKMFKDLDKVDLTNDTLYVCLKNNYPEYSFEYSRRISSVIPSTIYVSDVLNISRNTPVYYGRIHSFTKRYKQFEYGDIYVLANRFSFSTEFSATELKKLL